MSTRNLRGASLRGASLRGASTWGALLAVLLGVPSQAAPAAAQLPDLAWMSGQYVPSTQLPESEAGVQVSSYEVGFNAPIPLGEKTFLIPGLTYHIESVSFDGDTSGIQQLRAFHSVELPVMLVRLLPRDWALALRASATLAGDFTEVDERMVLVTGVAMATKVFSERVVFGFGAIVNYSFGTLLPLPALYLEWRPTSYFVLETILPTSLSARFVLGDQRVELGARAEFQGSSYAVRDERVRSIWPCSGGVDDPNSDADESVPDSSRCLDHVAYSVGNVGVSAGVRLVSSLWLSVFAGHSVYRRYERQNREDEGLEDDGTLPLAPVVRADLVFRIPTPAPEEQGAEDAEAVEAVE